MTKTTKKGTKLKQDLVEELRKCADFYPCLLVIRIENMRNIRLKELRTLWNTSRFFFGKNKVMVRALGNSFQEEHRQNLHKVAQCIKGDCGLFFTDKPKEEVVKFFESFTESNFARSGCVATEDISVKKGPLTFPGSMEVMLRGLGLKTLLKNGVIQLLADTQLCKKGDVLTPEQCRLLELFEIKMAEFRITVDCIWENGEFERLATDQEGEEAEGKVDDDTENEEEVVACDED